MSSEHKSWPLQTSALVPGSLTKLLGTSSLLWHNLPRILLGFLGSLTLPQHMAGFRDGAIFWLQLQMISRFKLLWFKCLVIFLGCGKEKVLIVRFDKVSSDQL